MRKYEMMIIFDEEVQVIDQCKAFLYETLKNNKVKIVDEKDMGSRDLAYEIEEKRRGHYYLLHIEAEQKSLPEVERAFKLNKCIMRYINLSQEK